ncbi:MAG: sporulation initiation factor Spo0A C-terminal domain-containing protein [Clostridia bacterium]|nr:sporulation initiation factor Spo0A C-terminal domain-containing protein [Clostridia bacterium]
MEREIADFLLLCGFSAKHLGYKYLKKAIAIYVESGMNVNCLGKNLYLSLSEDENGKSDKTIEKNITSSIEWAYLKGDVDFLEKNDMFGNNDRGRPTNNEFIALAATRIEYGYK